MRRWILLACIACPLVLASPAAAGAGGVTGRVVSTTAAAVTTSAATRTRSTTTAATGTSATSATTAGSNKSASESPVPVAASRTPPLGRHLSADQVLAIAQGLPRMRRLEREHPGTYDDAYLKGPVRWQVSFFSKRGAKEIGQVIIADQSGKVLEQWTGFQVAWGMARGYPGAFGRHVNALYIWLPLCLLFALPFVNPRRPFSLLHLDLLVLLSFSVSLAFFNHGEIYKSVPLAYPPLVYLFGRMLWLTRRRARPGPPLKLLVPVSWLAFGVMFLLGFRIALNVIDSNVIDVGYAGVIGAQRIADDRPLYGGWPSDNEHGDTYGPVTYESYVPFEQVFGWSGRWDDLPAAHAAAVVFDLLALGLIFLLGMRIRGPTLGVALAYAWVSYPFTLFALESNSNDTLVAVFLLAALLFASSPPARGAFAALAGLAKLAPLALAPVLATHGLRALPPGRRVRSLGLFALAFALVSVLGLIPALDHDSLSKIFHRTIVYQANRDSPFSLWGLYGGDPTLHGLETAVQVGAVLLALVLAVVPRRPDTVGLAAACAAILLALQLGVEHWFYLYIPWFFGLVMVALLGVRAQPAPPVPGTPTEPPARERSPEPDGPSAPARSSPLVAAWSSSG
jgi:Glycosyltransferase family 87